MLALAAVAAGSWWLAGLAAASALLVIGVSGMRAAPPERPSPATLDVASTPAALPVRAPLMRVPPSVDASSVVGTLFEASRERLDAIAAHLWLEDPPTATLRLVASAGPRTPAASPVSTDDPVLGVAVTSGNAVFEAFSRLQEGGTESVLWRFAVPVSVNDSRGAAAIDVSCPPTETPDAESLREITAALRGSLAAALALHVAEGQAETAAILLETARELSARLRSEEVLAVALDRAMELSSAVTGSILLPDAEGLLTIVASRGLPAEVVAGTRVRAGEGIAGWVHASGEPLLVEDLPGRPSSRRHGVRFAICAPIRDGGEAMGVISVGAHAYPARFTDTQVRAVAAIGAQTAIALANAHAAERSRELFLSSLEALALVLETKDPYSLGAAGRVSTLVLAIADALGLSSDEKQSLQVAALLHDVGMGIAAGSIGSTKRQLSTVERGLLRAHPAAAADVLRQIPALEAVVPIVYHHHEHFDGGGYSEGLTGEEIPLGSRVLAVADALVAMTGERSYRPPMSVEGALNELNAKSGSQFDPEVVEAVTRLLNENPELAFANR